MRAILRTPDGAVLRELPEPQPGPGQVRLRVELAGVCRTDVAAATGLLPVADGRILGHELVGRVDALGEGAPAVLGLRASVHPRWSDAVFLGLDVDGAFAEAVCVPASTLVPVPESLEARAAAFVEPVAAALAVLAVPVPDGARVGLSGDDRIATLTRRVLALRGLVPGEPPFDLLVHTTAEGLPDLSTLRLGGIVIVKSRPAGPVPVDLRAVTERRLLLVGVDHGAFDEAVALLADGTLQVDDLLGPVLPLSDFKHSFNESSTKMFLSPEA